MQNILWTIQVIYNRSYATTNLKKWKIRKMKAKHKKYNEINLKKTEKTWIFVKMNAESIKEYTKHMNNYQNKWWNKW